MTTRKVWWHWDRLDWLRPQNLPFPFHQFQVWFLAVEVIWMGTNHSHFHQELIFSFKCVVCRIAAMVACLWSLSGASTVGFRIILLMSSPSSISLLTFSCMFSGGWFPYSPITYPQIQVWLQSVCNRSLVGNYPFAYSTSGINGRDRGRLDVWMQAGLSTVCLYRQSGVIPLSSSNYPLFPSHFLLQFWF